MISLDSILIYSSLLVAIVFICTLAILIPVTIQLSKTLTSAQYLIDTINNELMPTLAEAKSGTENMKKAFIIGSYFMKNTINKAGIFLISGTHGVLTGVKNYLADCKSIKTSYNGSTNSKSKKQIK